MKRLFVALAIPTLVLAMSGTASASKAGDAKAAKKALLREADLPPGFSKTLSSSSDDSVFGEGNPSCDSYAAALKQARKARTGKADANYDGGGSERIAEAIRIAKNADAVKKITSEFATSPTRQCLQEELQNSIESDLGDTGTVDVAVEKSKLPKLGDQSAGWDMDVKVQTESDTQEVFISFVTVRVGRFTAGLQFQTAGDLVDEREAILKAATKRLKAVAK